MKEIQLTIGLPIRNEEATLAQFLQILIEEINDLPGYIIVEIIACLNGCTDSSEQVIDKFIQQNPQIKFKKIHSKEGKIKAQRKINLQRKFKGYLMFIDTDVKLGQNCILKLIEAMEENRHVEVAYARTKAENTSEKTFIEWLQFIHYLYPHLLTPKKYFHGRAFILRHDYIFNVASSCQNYRQYPNLKLEEGANIDDVHFSRLIAHLSGLDAIMEVEDAVVKFVPIRTYKDFERCLRRLFVELKRLDILYPEHKYLNKPFERKPNKETLKKLFFLERWQYNFYRLFEWAVKIKVKISINRQLKNGHKFKLWHPLTSTKMFL